MSANDKRAALEMHALGPQDRKWILGRLAVDDRQRLQQMLDELDSMEIRFDLEPDVLAAGAVPATAGAAPVAAAQRSALAAVRDADPPAMLSILGSEPAWLVRALFAVESWPWLAPVREGLAHQQAEAATPHLRSPQAALSPPPAVAAALVELVALRLRAMDTAASGNGHINGRGGLNGHARHGGYNWHSGHSGHGAQGGNEGRNGAHGLRKLWSGVRQWLP